jgi:16S rRNA (guanine527-N7)-methyltransferase
MNSRELLLAGARELGIVLTLEQVNSFFIFAAELRKWNRRINLTSITDERDVMIKHFLDSLAYLKGFVPGPGLRILDMGSGAGFPAIPLKIACPDLSITLVESVKKKASFLRHVLRTLPLDKTEVKDVRLEELPESSRGIFDVITARAFADIRSAVALGSPFLKPDGVIVLSRGVEEAIKEEVLDNLRFNNDKKITLTLPFSNYSRVIWVLKKQST